MEYKIYKLVSPITPNIVYIGISNTELLGRLFDHYSYAVNIYKSNEKKNEWILKNWRNIEILQIDIAENEKEARLKESQYVLECHEKGLEVLNDTYKQIIVYNGNGDFIEICPSIKYTLDKYEISPQTFWRKINSNKAINKNRFYSYNKDYKNKIEEYTPKVLGRPVLQYSLEGEFIKEFPNISSAVKEVKGTEDRKKGTGIVSCCQEKIRTAYGFKWRYKYGREYKTNI